MIKISWPVQKSWFDPRVRKHLGEGNGNSLQESFLGNPMEEESGTAAKTSVRLQRSQT